MKKFTTLLALLLLLTGALFAEEIQSDIPEENQTEINQNQEEKNKTPESEELPDLQTNNDYVFKMNNPGDWFIKLSINGGFPIKPEQMNFGLDLNLGFYYFLSSWFAVGGDVSFDYAPTDGEKVFYAIPFMFKTVFQYSIGKFEIPLFLGLGGAVELHNGNNYFGLIFRPELGFFYRFNQDWSFGATVGASIMPQWYKNSDYNYTGYIVDTGLSVRYHL